MRTLIENLEFVLTVDKDDRVLRKVSVLIEDDRILEIPSGGMPRVSFDSVIDGSRYGMVPGLIDSHVHLGETLSRAVFPIRASAFVISQNGIFCARKSSSAMRP